MQKEIERKFLVEKEDYKSQAYNRYTIIQGFLNKDKYRTVRVRIKGNKGFITVKGISSQDGLSRLEWEKEIPIEEAKELLKLCDGSPISKTRYEIKAGKHIYEVDEFHDKHQGLVIAEIELHSEEENFEKPSWLGKEVTGDKAYYNSQL